MSRLIPSLIENTLTIILAGGQGERLYPLTKDRSKPSVPFAGAYRIIDFTLSNCINSGLRKIYVLTQYKSQSLNRHIRHGWSVLQRELNEFIETVPPQHRIHTGWYEGTADAVYQNIYLLEQLKPDRVLVLSGDHIYRMDYLDLLNFHEEKAADVTMATYEFPREQATSFGVLQVNEEDRIMKFVEKPSHPPAIPGKSDKALINMGIYVFNTETLVRALIADHKDDNSQHDLGRNIFPALLEKNFDLYSYSFSRQSEAPYWRDVGSISMYYEANMHLLDGKHSLDLFSDEWPFRTDNMQQNPSRINLCDDHPGTIRHSMISNGCQIEGSLERCVLSPLVRVGAGSVIEGSIIFNGVTIGKNCRIRNAIIDKYATIPDECVIGYDSEADRRQFLVSPENIVVVNKGMQVERWMVPIQ
ncbi:MAG: glucose-1-phosphate adenylyltransferase [bacterium]|jgi:glucose-1-phosphate adenylyltransferase